MFEDRVQKGVALLNYRQPAWYTHIDVTILDIAMPERCIVGQLSGDYAEGIVDLFPYENGDFSLGKRVVEHGFDLPIGEPDKDKKMRELTDTWVKTVVALKG